MVSSTVESLVLFFPDTLPFKMICSHVTWHRSSITMVTCRLRCSYLRGRLERVDFLHHPFQLTGVLKHNHTNIGIRRLTIQRAHYQSLLQCFVVSPTWLESETLPWSSDSEDGAFETCVRKAAEWTPCCLTQILRHHCNMRTMLWLPGR